MFLQLDTVCAHAILFESDAPNLVASDNDLGSWDEEQLTSLIEHVWTLHKCFLLNRFRVSSGIPRENSLCRSQYLSGSAFVMQSAKGCGFSKRLACTERGLQHVCSASRHSSFLIAN